MKPRLKAWTKSLRKRVSSPETRNDTSTTVEVDLRLVAVSKTRAEYRITAALKARGRKEREAKAK
jgi:hypothetical protein